MGRRAVGVAAWILILLITLGSFFVFYHCVDRVMRLGLTHTLIFSGGEGTADFTAVSDLPIYIAGQHAFTIMGETVDFTVTLYDSEGVYLAHTDVYVYSPGYIVETLYYHEKVDYTPTPGAQYTIEVIGKNFEGTIEQPHTPFAEFVLSTSYSGDIIRIAVLVMALFWICMSGATGVVGVEEIKKRRAKTVVQQYTSQL